MNKMKRQTTIKTPLKKALDSKLLKKIDIYGYTPPILYNGENSYKSGYGGIITLVVIASYMLICAFTVWRYFQDSSPETNVNRLFTQDPPGFSVNKSSFPFALGIQNPGFEHFINESVYSMNAGYKLISKRVVNGTLQTVYETFPLETVRCSEAKLDADLFKNLDLANMFCLKELVNEKTTLDMRLKGVFESDSYGRLEFLISQCKNSTANNNSCAPKTEIDRLLRDSYFAINYVSFLTKTSNYSNPIETFPTSVFTSTSIDYTKYLRLYMNENQIITERSFTGYTEPQIQRYFSPSDFKTDMSNIARSEVTEPDIFFNLVIRMDQMTVVTRRRYKNIYEYLAEFGGLAQVITITGIILTFRMRKINMFMDLAEKYVNREQAYQGLVQSYINPDPNSSTISKSQRSSKETQSKERIKNKKDRIEMTEKDYSRNQLKSSILNKCDLKKIGNGTRVKDVKIDYNDIKDEFNDRYTNLNLTKDMKNHPGQKEEQSKKGGGAEEMMMKLEESTDDFELIMDTNPNSTSQGELFRYKDIKTQLRQIGCLKLFMQAFMPCITKKSKVNSAVEVAQNQIYSSYDLMKIIEVIEEFNKLKRLLLSKDQQVLFDIIPNNKLSYDNKLKRFSVNNHIDNEDQKDTHSQIEDHSYIQQSYYNIKTKENKSVLDKNLMKCLSFLYPHT